MSRRSTLVPFRWLLPALVALTLIAAGGDRKSPRAQLTPPPLSISAPADGTVFTQGAEVAIEVATLPGVTFNEITILGEEPGQIEAEGLTSFKLTVTTGSVGPKRITAMGVDSAGTILFSESRTIVVESGAAIRSISTAPGTLRFRHVGQTTPLNVTGMFSDNATYNVSGSSRLSATPLDSAIATVDRRLIVTAAGPGETRVVVKYGSQTIQVPVIVPRADPGDLDGDGDVDQDDLNILVDNFGAPVTLANDARDLNHDGQIGSSDVNLLVASCTNPPCTPPGNTPPISNAGADQEVGEGSQVTLSGVSSRDPDGDTITFAWKQVAGPSVILSDRTSATPAFTAPLVGPLGTVLAFELTVRDAQVESQPDSVTISVTNVNDPPKCNLAEATPNIIWPPNHRFVPIVVRGVSDPNGDPVTLVITKVTQDEPVAGPGPDAQVANESVLVASERSGAGNGRVYRVTFVASDGKRVDGACEGSVVVCVPHDRGGNACADDGQLYDSTGSQ